MDNNIDLLIQNSNIYFKIYYIITDIINISKNNIIELLHYNIDEILNLDSKSLLFFLNNIIQIFKFNYIYSYKYLYYEPLLNLIVNIIINSKQNIDLNYNNYSIINSINQFKNSHIYLKKIKNIIIENNYINISILINSSHKSTLPTFLFWWDFFKNNIFSHLDYLELINGAITNSDDRIFKYLINVKNIEMLKDFYKNNGIFIITKLLKSIIPKKYKLKRIKLLSSKYDLSQFYTTMINNVESLEMLNILTIYYYNEELKFNNLINIFNNTNIKCSEAIIYYNNLKTNNEKNIFCILCNLNGYYNKKIKLFNLDYKLLEENYIYILSKIEVILSNIYDDDNKLLNNILKYYIQTKYIESYININIIGNSLLYRYTKFFVIDSELNIYNIYINKILHLLRCCMKKKFLLKQKYFKYNFKPILNEINNFIPNNKFSVLKNGSINYQLKQQDYNLIPPRHLLPLENILNNNFLIKEKADGILINTIPLDIYPINNELYKYEVKCEFIESLNLYLIYDINIPNTSIYERQIFLRNLHYCTQYYPKVIYVENFDNLFDEIMIERIILEKFIKSNLTKVKWYPKCSWKIFMNQENYNNITSIISNNNYFNLFNNNNKIFNIDGFILTPLNGSRELKIKPKDLLTIDLLFNGINWLDSDKNIYENIEINNIKYENKIYRCYPLDNNKYIPREIRYDKKYPNSKIIINQIINIYNFNWETNKKLFLNNDSRLYYEKVNKNIKLDIINIIKNHQQILENLINIIKPELNNNWLDLGCGKCKLFKYIQNKYYPKIYLGIDNDINILSESLYLVDKNLNKFNIYPTNLGDIWDKNNIWDNFNWKIKYNYIIANFSLMYFCNDNFWLQLNKIVQKGTKFIFNITKKNQFWENNNSFLKSDEKSTLINFEWVHDNEIKEPLILKEEIENYIKIYNWKIIIEKEFNENLLTSCYKWYIIEKL